MREMFRGCSELSELGLTNWNTSSAYYRYNMFDGCKKLTSIPELIPYTLSTLTNTPEQNLKEYGVLYPEYPVLVGEWQCHETVTLKLWAEYVASTNLRDPMPRTLLEVLGAGEMSIEIDDFFDDLDDEFAGRWISWYYSSITIGGLP